MARKARQRISYVLPLSGTAGGHRLGVNGLAIDDQSSTLYSGGRDGSICAWDLNFDLHNPPTANAPNEKPPPSPATTLRRQFQAHTHWINDLLLTQQNQALVSASSDISVKVWRPASKEEPQTIGIHNDFVKVLACPDQNADWVASGGLDRKILFWDLNGAGQRLSIDVGLEEGASGLGRDKGSVYALAATNSIIGSGGPESAVRIWDPRSGKRITKFMGHTDNVRDILISHDATTVMTASSDQTVKVWSVTAGRCMNTFTMHDASVWSLWSDHPQLSVFWSSDRDGLIAKTDTRGCAELEDGLSVAVAQEHQGVHRIVAAGDYLWTGTARPSINRWRDVNTDDAEVEMPDGAKNNHRASMTTSRSRLPSPPPQTNTTPKQNMIPLKHVLRLSNTIYFPRIQRSTTRDTNTEHVDADESIVTEPVRSVPDSHIEGQNGLIKHQVLSDRRRVLTQDTAGDCIMWDLIRCRPIKSFGKRHLDNVVDEVDTIETVPNWCSVDTRTGALSVTVDENNAFDAEMYADELDIAEHMDFKEDQRINLGKWVLRYLFANLIDVEVQRDQQIRRHLLEKAMQQKMERENAPTSIQLPTMQATGFSDASAPPSTSTMRAVNGSSAFTPGLSIGQATPAWFGAKSKDTGEDGAPLAKTTSGHSRKSVDGKDYFSSPPTATAGLTSPTETSRVPQTPGSPLPEDGDLASPLPGETPSKFGRKFKMPGMSFSMKKLTRAPTNDSTTTTKPAVIEEKGDENDSEDTRSNKTIDNSRIVEENLLGCIQKIRFGYEDDLAAQLQRQTAMESAGGALGSARDLELPSQITPSLPNETPVLKPPRDTVILIQEETTEAGGVADLWEGTVGSTGESAQVDLLEKRAPMWLGETLLRNSQPLKDVVKISFVLEPYDGLLPSIAAEGNNRLNANRMLRARKILSYVADRLEPASQLYDPVIAAQLAPPPSAAVASPPTPTTPAFSSNNPYAKIVASSTSSPRHNDHDSEAESETENPFADPDDPPEVPSHTPHTSTIVVAQQPNDNPDVDRDPRTFRPEEYLELYCNGHLVPPRMTLATIRSQFWRSGGDVTLFYRANGRKKMVHAPEPTVAAAVEGASVVDDGTAESGSADGERGAAMVGINGGGGVVGDRGVGGGQGEVSARTALATASGAVGGF